MPRAPPTGIYCSKGWVTTARPLEREREGGMEGGSEGGREGGETGASAGKAHDAVPLCLGC